MGTLDVYWCVDENGGVGAVNECESCRGEGEVVRGIVDGGWRCEVHIPGERRQRMVDSCTYAYGS